jgi:hypothetical protein
MKYVWLWLILILASPFAMGCASEHRPRLIVPMAKVTPVITADVNDIAWENAAIINSLLPCDRNATHNTLPNKTQVKILWDERYLYLRFICEDDQIFTPHGSARNGLHHEGDVTEVFIDPVGDGRQYVEVQVNPVGGVLDVMHVNTTTYTPNRTPVLPRKDWATAHWGFAEWDMQDLRTAASIRRINETNQQWITDMAIPATSLLRRLERETFSPTTLRINFLRCDGPVEPTTGKRSKLIATSWSHVPTGLPHLAPGTMGFITLTDK